MRIILRGAAALCVSYFVVRPPYAYHTLWCGRLMRIILRGVAALRVSYFVVWPPYAYHTSWCGRLMRIILCGVAALCVSYLFGGLRWCYTGCRSKTQWFFQELQ